MFYSIAVVLVAVFFVGLHQVFPVLDAPVVCSQPDNEDWDVLANVGCFFSTNFFTAKHKFRANAIEAGADWVESALVVGDLTMEFALFVGNSSKLLMHISGTHGTEGFVGSAIQSAILRKVSQNDESLDFDEGRPHTGSSSMPSVLFVHALNPFGMANFRRWNENGVDLNRNALFTEEEWDMVKNREYNVAGYEEMQGLFNPDEPPSMLSFLQAAFSKLSKVVTDMPMIKRAAVAAQYQKPEFLFYGGQKLSNSHAQLSSMLEKYGLLESVKELILLDVHSGLGPRGLDTLLLDASDATPYNKVFGGDPSKMRFAQAGPAGIQDSGDKSATSGASAGYDLTVGTVTEGYPKLFKNAVHTAAITQEFGTHSMIKVMKAMVQENQAHRFLSDDQPAQTHWKNNIFEAFNVQRHSFQQSTIERGMEVYHQSIQCLIRSDECMRDF